MNCVGIDVSKGKSMIAVMRPFGEVVISPFLCPYLIFWLFFKIQAKTVYPFHHFILRITSA